MRLYNSLPLPKLDARSESGGAWLADHLEQERLARSVPLYHSPYHERARKNPKITFLDLFFDLSFVACLTRTDIGVLVAFLVLLWWSWASSIIYNVRFGRIDVCHRFFTFIYIAVFAFLGAYSLGFQPDILKFSTDFAAAGEGEAVEPTEADLQAWQSWRGITIAFALGRLVLMLQWLIAAIDGGWRRLSLATILPIIGCNVSGWIAFSVHYMEAYTSRANSIRLGLLFGAIAFEMLLSLVVARLPSPVPVHSHLLLERMALLTLIILGEGFIGITRGVSIVVTSFGLDSSSYIQLFCGLALYVLMWTLLFEPLSMTSTMSDLRTHFWTLLHLALHLLLLMWLDSLDLALLTSSLNTAFTSFGSFLRTTISSINDYLAARDANSDTSYSFRLPQDLLPTFGTALELIGSSLADFNATLQEGVETLIRTVDAYAAANGTAGVQQYRTEKAQSLLREIEGQLLLAFAETYEYVPNDEAQRLIEEKFSGNASLAATPLLNVTTEDFGELVSSIDNAVLPSSRFILPSAGGILVFSSVLSVLQRTPKDRTDYLLLVPRTCAGILLCLLALLDIGKTTVTYEDLTFETSQISGNIDFPTGTAPIYRFLYDNWLLPFQVFLFSTLVIYELGVLRWAKQNYRARRQTESPTGVDEKNGRRAADDDEEETLDEQRQHDTEAPVDMQ